MAGGSASSTTTGTLTHFQQAARVRHERGNLVEGLRRIAQPAHGLGVAARHAEHGAARIGEDEEVGGDQLAVFIGQGLHGRLRLASSSSVFASEVFPSSP